FQSKGFFDVQVDPRFETGKNGERELVYHVSKNKRSKVREVDVAGNQHLDEKELLGHVTVKKAHFFSHGKFSQKLVRASADNLKRVYQANGFSSVQVTPEIKSQDNGIAVTLRVNEGPQDIVQALNVEGNKTVP